MNMQLLRSTFINRECTLCFPFHLCSESNEDLIAGAGAATLFHKGGAFVE